MIGDKWGWRYHIKCHWRQPTRHVKAKMKKQSFRGTSFFVAYCTFISKYSLVFLLVICFTLVFSGVEPLGKECRPKKHVLNFRVPPTHLFINDTGIGELFSMFRHDSCMRTNFFGACKRGTLEIDRWLLDTLSFQRNVLQGDFPLDQVQTIFSHNAFNNRADGYGLHDSLLRKVLRWISKDEEDIVIAQQEYSMTDQLNMGVRNLMLDPFWFAGSLRLCHAGTKISAIDDIIDYIETKMNTTFNFTSHQVGCSLTDRLWDDGIQEIAEWVAQHSSEVLIIFINDSPSWDLNHWKEVFEPFNKFLAPYLLRTDEKNKFWPHRWPSIKEILSLGRRVVLMGSRYIAKYGALFTFEYGWVGYPSNLVKYFKPFPHCGGVSFSDWSCFGGESCIYGPLYYGPDDMGLITGGFTNHHHHYTVKELLNCGIKMILLDQISPSLMAHAIWTFARGEPRSHPSLPSEPLCFYISAKDHRWYSSKCKMDRATEIPCKQCFECDKQIRAFACQSIEDPRQWRVSELRSTKWEDGEDSCDIGYHFSVPTNSMDAHVLNLHNNLTVPIWINIRRWGDGSWEW